MLFGFHSVGPPQCFFLQLFSLQNFINGSGTGSVYDSYIQYESYSMTHIWIIWWIIKKDEWTKKNILRNSLPMTQITTSKRIIEKYLNYLILFLNNLIIKLLWFWIWVRLFWLLDDSFLRWVITQGINTCCHICWVILCFYYKYEKVAIFVGIGSGFRWG